MSRRILLARSRHSLRCRVPPTPRDSYTSRSNSTASRCSKATPPTAAIRPRPLSGDISRARHIEPAKAGATIPTDPADPLKATLTGKIHIDVQYGGKADVAELHLVRRVRQRRLGRRRRKTWSGSRNRSGSARSRKSFRRWPKSAHGDRQRHGRAALALACRRVRDACWSGRR